MLQLLFNARGDPIFKSNNLTVHQMLVKFTTLRPMHRHSLLCSSILTSFDLILVPRLLLLSLRYLGFLHICAIADILLQPEVIWKVRIIVSTVKYALLLIRNGWLNMRAKGLIPFAYLGHLLVNVIFNDVLQPPILDLLKLVLLYEPTYHLGHL